MKRILALTALILAAASPAWGQYTPPARTGYCYNAVAGWIAIASSSSATVSYTPPAISLYGVNGSSSVPILCDANGNISAGAILGYTIPALAAGCLQSAGTTGPLSWAACSGSSGTVKIGRASCRERVSSPV